MEYFKVMEDLIEKRTQIIAICFGLMVNANTALRKIIYTKLVVLLVKYKLIYELLKLSKNQKSYKFLL
jgi:hypothetical protein